MVRASKEVQDIIANMLLAFVRRGCRLELCSVVYAKTQVMRNGINLPKYPQMDSHSQMQRVETHAGANKQGSFARF